MEKEVEESTLGNPLMTDSNLEESVRSGSPLQSLQTDKDSTILCLIDPAEMIFTIPGDQVKSNLNQNSTSLMHSSLRLKNSISPMSLPFP